MTTLTFLVDEAGDLWNALSRDFHHRLGVRDPDFDIAAYAVKNFGWIEIGYGSRRMTVRLRPATAEPKAVAFLKDVLKGTDKSEIMLHAWLQSWKKERFLAPGAALARLDALLAPTSEGRSARFSAVPVPVEQIFRDKQINLVQHFQMWRSHLGLINSEDAVRLAMSSPLSRTGVLERPQLGEPFVYRHLAAALRYHDQNSRIRLIGTDVAQSPDKDYGAWCVRSGYERAVSSSEPVIDDVCAVIRRPNGPSLRTEYRRLLAGYRTPGGADLVMVVFEPKPPPSLSRVA